MIYHPHDVGLNEGWRYMLLSIVNERQVLKKPPFLLCLSRLWNRGSRRTGLPRKNVK